MRIPSALAALLLAAGCGGTVQDPPSAPASSAPEVLVRFGQEVTIQTAGITLRFTDVTEESRCPTGVQCIQAGRASILMGASKPGSPGQELSLTIPGQDRATYAGYEIRLAKLDPYPTEQHRPTDTEYVATLVVTPL